MIWNKVLIMLFGLGLLTSLTACAHSTPLAETAMTPWLTVVQCNQASLQAEVVADPASRSRGLMERRELPENTGMLFVFPQPQTLSFWMRNTYLPLSIAFMDTDRHILNMQDLTPFDETGRASSGEARYALEAPQGWFVQHGVREKDGCVFHLPADMPIR